MKLSSVLRDGYELSLVCNLRVCANNFGISLWPQRATHITYMCNGLRD